MNGAYNVNDDIVAPITPYGQGATAIVRASGGGVIEKVATIVNKRDKLIKQESNTIYYYNIIDGDIIIDDVLISVFRAPKSYTGEDIVEINCHGNPIIVNRIISLMLKSGMRYALEGEFTYRAVLNGKLDLLKAEAINDLIGATSLAMVDIARKQMQGSLYKRVDNIKTTLVNVLSMIEGNIDFPDEEDFNFDVRKRALNMLESINRDIKQILDSYNYGKMIKSGIKCVIAGKTNVGKSSLLNLLLKEDRAIVSHYHGTTRDTIEEYINIGSFVLQIIDTAGIRDSSDAIELEGINRAKTKIDMSQLILAVFDGSVGIDDNDRLVVSMLQDKKVIPIINKIDIAGDRLNIWKSFVRESFNTEAIEISAKTSKGIGRLEKAIESTIAELIGNYSDRDIITSERHRLIFDSLYNYIKEAIKGIKNEVGDEIVSITIRDALDSIFELVGNISERDIINNIFKNFCVGK